jgi:surface antigen
MIEVKGLTVGVCALALVAAVAPAGAQVSPLGPGAFAVPHADLQLLAQAEAKLYDPALKVGATASWRNAQTGDSGTVTLISTFARDAAPCRRLAHEIKVRGIQDVRQFLISRCRDADGSWKIVP